MILKVSGIFYHKIVRNFQMVLQKYKNQSDSHQHVIFFVSSSVFFSHAIFIASHLVNYILASTHLIPSWKILAYKFLGFARAGFAHISVKWNERKNSVCTHAYQMCKQVNSLLKASSVLCSFRFITSSLHFVKLFRGYGIVNNLKNAMFLKTIHATLTLTLAGQERG